MIYFCSSILQQSLLFQKQILSASSGSSSSLNTSLACSKSANSCKSSSANVNFSFSCHKAFSCSWGIPYRSSPSGKDGSYSSNPNYSNMKASAFTYLYIVLSRHIATSATSLSKTDKAMTSPPKVSSRERRKSSSAL